MCIFVFFSHLFSTSKNLVSISFFYPLLINPCLLFFSQNLSFFSCFFFSLMSRSPFTLLVWQRTKYSEGRTLQHSNTPLVLHMQPGYQRRNSPVLHPWLLHSCSPQTPIWGDTITSCHSCRKRPQPLWPAPSGMEQYYLLHMWGDEVQHILLILISPYSYLASRIVSYSNFWSSYEWLRQKRSQA